jgi:hypothetical protein
MEGIPAPKSSSNAELATPDQSLTLDDVLGEVYKVIGRSALIICQTKKLTSANSHVLAQYYSLGKENLQVSSLYLKIKTGSLANAIINSCSALISSNDNSRGPRTFSHFWGR